MRRQARARYGTGDFLQLNKRDCGTSIELIPCGADFLKVVWKIGNDNHVFWASSVMQYQFYSFVLAVYELYGEGDGDAHRTNYGSRKKWRTARYDAETRKSTFEHYCVFDGEGVLYQFLLRREFIGDSVPDPAAPDPVGITIGYPDGTEFHYTLDGRNLCYAVAKAYTEALKKYGFYGYFLGTGDDGCCTGDIIPLYMFLFIKAYALGNMEAREMKRIWTDRENGYRAYVSPFEKELELLLFDM